MKLTPFTDPLVAAIRQNNACYQLSSGIKLLLPQEFGFCQGVRKAIGSLVSLLDSGVNQTVWLLGPMIHNPEVNQWFADRQLRILEEDKLAAIFSQASPEDIFVIPAFGLSLPLSLKLAAFVRPPGRILDCSCFFIRRIWEVNRAAGQQGRAILLHGSPRHPETQAIWSRVLFEAPAGALIPHPAAARQLLAAVQKKALSQSYPSEWLSHPEKLALCPWLLINQTTMLNRETKEISELIRRERPGDDAFQQSSTICSATQQRQAQAEKLCQQNCEMFLILGGINSSNTTQLYKLARNSGKKCYFIQNPQDLQPQQIRHYQPESQSWQLSSDWRPEICRQIGILVGASCPDSQLGSLIRQLELCF